MTNDYHGPCTILLDRSTTVEVRRGGRIESVSMPAAPRRAECQVTLANHPDQSAAIRAAD